MGVLDIVIIVLALIFAIRGFVRGFTKQFLGSLSWLVAGILAIIFCETLAKILSDFSLADTINNKVFNWFASKGDAFTTQLPIITKEHLSGSLSELGIPSFLHSLVIGNIDMSNTTDISVATLIAPKITYLALVIISYILIYVLSFIILKVIAHMFGKAIRGSAIGLIDGVLGFMWGCVKATIVISVAMLLLSLLTTLPIGESINNWLIKDMKLNEDNIGIAKFIYENNPILILLEKFNIKF